MAKAGGGRKRAKGAADGPALPPNVRRAAARLKDGKATSEDQKLLAAWRDRQKKREELRRPQTPEEMEAHAAARIKDLGLEGAVAVRSGPPRDREERRALAVAERRGKGEQAVTFSGRPAARVERGPDGDLRVSTRDEDGPIDLVVVARDPELGWVERYTNHRTGTKDKVVAEHPSRAAAERAARRGAEWDGSPGEAEWRNTEVVPRLDRGRGDSRLDEFAVDVSTDPRRRWFGPDGEPHTLGEIYIIKPGKRS